jgi:hypothetical protein
MKAPSPEPTGCPELAEEALYGLPGEIVKIILPHSEAHLAALLINVLVAFGNALGRSAYLRVGADFHYCNLFALLVGRASKARKGASLGFVLDLFRAADRFWYEECILTPEQRRRPYIPGARPRGHREGRRATRHRSRC